MTTSLTDSELKFNSVNDLKIESIGSVTEKSTSCQIKHIPLKLKQAQKKPSRCQANYQHKMGTSTTTKIGRGLKSNNLTGIVVTNDNKLLLCNCWSVQTHFYKYSNCNEYETRISFSSRPYGVAVLPVDDMAEVTLPDENNTITTTNCNKIRTTEACFGVCKNKNNILLGCLGTIHLLNLEGSYLSQIKTQNKATFCSIGFSEINQQIMCRGNRTLHCLRLTGGVVYTHKVKGEAALTLDRDGNVDFNDANEIYRLSSNGNCKDMKMQNNKVKKSYSIALNKDFTRLFVIFGCRSVNICGCC